MTTRLLAILLLLLTVPARSWAAGDSTLTFEQHIRPILRAHCLECHGEGRKLRGSLDLRLRRFALSGGDHGPALVPRKPSASLLFTRVRDHEMPPGKVKLSPDEITHIERWIAAGAVTARPEPEKLPPGQHISDDERGFWSFQPIRRPPLPSVHQASLVRTPIDAFLLAKLEHAGLSFAPAADRYTLLRRATFDLTGLPPTPEEIDAFLTDRRTGAWERVVDRLLASTAYGERWGRHWLDVAGYADSHGGPGTDPVRPHSWKYRDYVIRSFNSDKPFNRFIVEQLAGDELVRQPYTNLHRADLDRLIATGFLRNAPDGTASPGADRKAASNQVVADTLQIVSTALLGLTVHCAQCHNHRYDPIPQTDYYHLRALFEPAYDVKDWRTPQGRRVSLMTPAERKKALAIEQAAARIDAERQEKLKGYIEATLHKQLAKVPADVRPAVEKAYRTAAAKRTSEQRKLLREHPSVNVGAGSLYLYDSKAAKDLAVYADRAAKLRATKPVEDFIDALTEVPGKIPTTLLFYRGDPDQPRQAVAPGGLTILGEADLGIIPAKDPARSTTGRRLAFARRLTSGKHPLTARVLVNRVWMHHFGTGIVATPGDFGTLGARPTHPELLDWLASEFMRDWSLKRLHRLILISTAYRQSSRIADCGMRIADSKNPATPGSRSSSSNPQSAIRNPQSIDPDNRLLWRMPLHRLEAEAVRDAILAVSGRINRRPFGRPVPVTPDSSGQIVLGIDTRDSAGRPRGEPAVAEGFHRRSVYVQVRRSMPLGVLETFDAPNPSPCCEKRASSTVAPQALMLMNNGFVIRSASAFADRVHREVGSDPRAQVRQAWKLAFGPPPTKAQIRDAAAFLDEQTALYRAKKTVRTVTPPEQQALATFCHALLSSNPFLYVE
jgi:mono/diheme cytochrome c family protein